MDEYIDRAVKRYSALFKLPSRRTLLIELLTTCLLCGILIATTFKFSPFYWFILGLTLGTTLFVLTIASDALIQFSSMKTDPVFNLSRRPPNPLREDIAATTATEPEAAFGAFHYTDVWFR